MAATDINSSSGSAVIIKNKALYLWQLRVHTIVKLHEYLGIKP